MRLFISIPDSNDPVAFEIDGGAAIEVVKRKLQDELGVPASQQQLYKGDDKLDNSKSLSSYGITVGETIRLIADHPDAIKRERAGILPDNYDRRAGARRLTVPAMSSNSGADNSDLSGMPLSVQHHFAALRMQDKVNGNDPSVGTSASNPGHYQYGACSIKGMEYMNPKKENQDAYFVLDPFKKTSLLLGMFDGHGAYGKLASNYCRDKLPAILEKNKLAPGKSIESIKDAFIKTDKDMKREYKDRVGYSGTTALTALLIGNDLYVANAGDSRAVMATVTEQNGIQCVKAVELSDDHKPDLPEERKRIEKCGGRVEPARDMETGEYFLPMRVWLKQVNLPGLAMSRSLGDAVSHTIGVTAEAEVRHVKIDRNADKFLILATDGVWEFMTSQQAVDCVVQNLHRGPQDACERLCKDAYLRWEEEGEGVADDTTAVLLIF
mmetsp:Transcript_31397/g.50694  ORF Transcript_31397/g.50694 Transcript_31397/m.50694 type:complete len:438 (-) Transcript_31397:351-1664(-)|eukprot:CAMPEP_0184656160 /NCGR_PEP_ID=MMETSP0308-20130426/15849_1 /TAXON_ID=38269 /ORGANISM="Gloeochaete witrockiana, Strain SAG 46.84" /LENGTH=437 /DNA_ID=CAMNT_0027093145 /DNA_START=169 /DNA_END=1482 /DNA_ORIENTATION=-